MRVSTDVAREREVEGDLLQGDIGEGLPFTQGSFNDTSRWDCVRGGRGCEMRGHLRRLVFVGMRVGPVLGNAAQTRWVLSHCIKCGGRVIPTPALCPTKDMFYVSFFFNLTFQLFEKY